MTGTDHLATAQDALTTLKAALTAAMGASLDRSVSDAVYQTMLGNVDILAFQVRALVIIHANYERVG